MKNLIISAGMLMLASSCSVGQPEIKYGSDECAHCRMNVMDAKFGAALQTVKGRSYVFDAPECMVPFVSHEGRLVEEEVKGWYVSDFAHPGTLIDAKTAFYLHAPTLKSPMRGNVAAFSSAADRKVAEEHFPGEELDWPAVKKLFTDE
ncbi:MAG: nitrous oxide reductase accessory protein NosL [Flavobacteriales bacterium]|jgi:copper chaperone NosL|nr:nitrous oxide reductase accessory protein NosL [Flavobacteriales bacterium]MCB0758358.1 nitrous oxide reductase accessory protein NosL [Flavobacteriales bacterium]